MAYINRGACKAEIKNLTEAIKDYDQAIKIDPYNCISYHNRGLNKKKLNDIDGAMSDYMEALKINPEDVYIDLSIAKTNFDLKKYQLANQSYTKVIEINPSHSESYYMRGYCNYRENKSNQAISDWEKASKLGHKDAAKLLEKHFK